MVRQKLTIYFKICCPGYLRLLRFHGVGTIHRPVFLFSQQNQSRHPNVLSP